MFLDDAIRLRHMGDAAKDALAFVEGKQRSDLEGDRQLTLALVKCIEIVGEAASAITDDTKARAPEIPWPQIRGMRNRLIHAYYEIDLDVLWDTVTNDLPTMLASVEKMLFSEDPSSGPKDAGA
jgi:uncharacterized protein with HEPN domain